MNAAGSTIRVRFPGDNIPERIYAIRAVMEGILGQRIELLPDDCADYRIELENGASLIVRDGFFRDYTTPRSYLQRGSIPTRVSHVSMPHAPERDLVTIFGNDEYRETPGHVICGVDIFGSAFFMLSRWEEHVLAESDAHQRTPSATQLSVRAGFHLRPVVNEYAEALWTALCALGHQGERAPRTAALVVTHDVDRIYHRPMISSVLRSLRQRAWKRAGVTAAYGVLRIDPWRTFQGMMDQDAGHGQRARFYFICGGATKHEGYYDLEEPLVRRLLAELIARGHVIGLHPSYDTYDCPSRWLEEKQRLDSLLPEPCSEGRQHYLRFRNPDTWRIWEQAGMRVDSTMGFGDRIGYRCGTGDEFQVFDILARTTLSLRERPLVLMDSALRGVSPVEREEHIRKIREATAKYRMTLTVLFHNHLLDSTPWNQCAPNCLAQLNGARLAGV